MNIYLSMNDSNIEDVKVGVGKYVYYEPNRQTIHVDRKCKKLNRHFVQSERIELSYIVEWREKNFENSIISNFCPLCVSDEDYDFIMEAIQEQIFDKYDN